MTYARIVGTGSYLPEKVLSNAEIAERIDTSDEWIVVRTGIRARHIAAEQEKTSDLALAASQRAIAAAGIDKADIDLIIVATSTPDMIFPSAACVLQDKLGVDVHLFKVGEYKSAAEPYVLDAASPASKEADLFWMNDVWQRYLGDIAKARRLDPAQLAAGIDTLPEGVAAAGGDLAKFALQQKLVTSLKTREEFEDLMIERGVADDDADGGFRNIDFGSYLCQLDARRNPVDSRPQVAVVVAEVVEEVLLHLLLELFYTKVP